MPMEKVEIGQTRSFRVVGALLVVGLVLVIAVISFIRVDVELERSRSVESDNRTWMMSQVEVDFQRLAIALLQAQASTDDASLERLRVTFDILVSRVLLIGRAPGMSDVGITRSDAWSRLAAPDGLIARFVPVIDGTDDALRHALPALTADAEQLGPEIRKAIVGAMTETVKLSDASRADLRNSLHIFTAALVVSVLALLVLLATLYMQSRAKLRYARMLELAVHNLRATIESSRDAVLIVNGRDCVIEANRAGEQMLGRRFSTHAPVALATLLPGEGGAVTAPGESVMTRCHHADGREIPVEVSIATTKTGTGRQLKIAFLRDMSDQLERERRLAEATELARKGEETKDRFLAVMSHEMRTPLTGLLSAADLIESGAGLDAQQVSLLEIIRSCGMAALEQVNNVLELSRLSARDTTDYPCQSFHLADAIREQVQQFEALALRRGNTIGFRQCGTCTSPYIRAPLPLLRRIVNNLLSNAVKFTRNGTIDVQLEWTQGAAPGRCGISLSVTDSGIGIAQADLTRIFYNFETLDTSYARTQEGTGLGLGIVKLAAEAMQGTIQVESSLGKGSRFAVTFEAEPSQPPVETDPPVPALSTCPSVLRILLAEDNDINRMLLERQLAKRGYQVTAVSNGQEAVEAAARASFDVVLMDIAMPHLDGVEATRLLRDRGLLDGTPVIALTAQAAPNRVQMLRDAGMSEVIIKPVPISLLEQMIHQLVVQTRGDRMAPGSGAALAPLVDCGRLDELIEDIGPEMLRKVAARFEAEFRDVMLLLGKGLSDGESVRMSRVAHKAAGGAAVLALDLLSAELQSLERDAETKDPQALLETVERIAAIAGASFDGLNRRVDMVTAGGMGDGVLMKAAG